MDCARINCAHDDAEIWGRMIENVREAASRLERPCRVLMDIAGPKCRILRVKAPAKTRLSRGDRVMLVDELREKTREPIAFSLNFPELVDQLVVGSEVFIDDGKAAARVVAKAAGRAEIEVYAAREKGVSPYVGDGPVFVHADGCEPYAFDGAVPNQLRRRLLAARAYDGEGMMVGSEVVEGAELEAGLDDLFAAPGAAFVHLHYARPGCFACRVDQVR